MIKLSYTPILRISVNIINSQELSVRSFCIRIHTDQSCDETIDQTRWKNSLLRPSNDSRLLRLVNRYDSAARDRADNFPNDLPPTGNKMTREREREREEEEEEEGEKNRTPPPDYVGRNALSDARMGIRCG